MTASIQDSNLELIHTKIQFKSQFCISDLSAQKGTWLRIPQNIPKQLTSSTELKIHKSVLSVTSISKEPLCLNLTCGGSSFVVNDRFTLSSKRPADFILPSFEGFSAEIFYQDEEFFVMFHYGTGFFKVSEEIQLVPGDEICVGDLVFEVCRFNWGVWRTIGMRAMMEDSDVVMQDLRILPESVSYYAIFDGHGGKECSNFLKSNLHKFLNKHLKNSFDISSWPIQISSAFSECDEAFNITNPELSKLIGSSALVCLIYKDHLIIANCGDCRAVLSRKGDSIQLSTDHRPSHQPERMRIEKSGGFISSNRVQGKLGLTRSFGDFEYKFPKKVIISDPEIQVYSIDYTKDEFIIIACDGMFEAFSNQDAVKNVRSRLRRMKATEQDPSRVVKDLITEAVHTRRTLDNVSAILVTLSAGVV